MVKIDESYREEEADYKISDYYLKFLKPQNKTDLDGSLSKYEVNIKIEFFEKRGIQKKVVHETQLAELWLEQISESFNMTGSYIFSWRIKEVEAKQID